MKLSRRFIVIALIAVACATSLAFASTASANIVRDLEKNCQAKGGVWETGVVEGKGFARCSVRSCTLKVLAVGSIVIWYPSCKTLTAEIRWSL